MFKRKRSYEEGPDSQMQTSHLSDLPYSRTMKRTRDRPSEESIHQRTLDLLSKGAVLDMQAPKTAQDAQAPQQLSHASTVARPQRSLHNFWNIPSAPSSTPAGSAPVVIAMATSCDNCKGPLRPGNNNGIDQDCCDVVISCNPTDLPDSACGQCRRNVCDLCSVSRIDGPRMCFGCVERGGRLQTGGVETTGQTPFQRMWG